MLVVSLLIIAVGLPIVSANFYDTQKVSYWVFGVLFVGIGLLIAVKSTMELNKIKNDMHPILNAITMGDKNFIVWMYQKQITSKVEGVNVGKSNNIVFITKTNKMIEIALNNKTSPDALISYISEQFPNALVGYTNEHQATMKHFFKN